MKQPGKLTRNQKIFLAGLKLTKNKEAKIKEITPDHRCLISHGLIEIQIGDRGCYAKYCGDNPE